MTLTETIEGLLASGKFPEVLALEADDQIEWDFYDTCSTIDFPQSIPYDPELMGNYLLFNFDPERFVSIVNSYLICCDRRNLKKLGCLFDRLKEFDLELWACLVAEAHMMIIGRVDELGDPIRLPTGLNHHFFNAHSHRLQSLNLTPVQYCDQMHDQFGKLDSYRALKKHFEIY